MYLLALDQGTSSSRSVVFDRAGHVVAMAQRELPQHYPQPGWVEHDPQDIWATQLATAREALAQAGLRASEVAGLGITNQRETTVVWHRLTGEPIHPAIVWQDRRTEQICQGLRDTLSLGQNAQDRVQAKTGLCIDPYFSATKVQWLLDHVPNARAQAERGELAFGTVDSWLIYKLTGGKRHVTDVSNASRTLLFNIHTQRWDDGLLALFNIPAALLPEVLPSSANFGSTDADVLGSPVRIAGVAGDQQSALMGQACWAPGMAKNTYGTGCFMLMHTGSQAPTSRNGLITTAAAQLDATPQYALEGSVFMGGAVVQWLRDGLGLIASSADLEPLAASVPDAAGVMLVPAFTGLGAPYWDAQARGALVGLTRGSTKAHMAYAALQSIAFQSAALLQCMNRDAQNSGAQAIAELRVDGGACVNNLLMQMQADLLGIPVVRPEVIETTALGAAYLAGWHLGLYSGLDELRAQWRVQRRFEPRMSADQAQDLMHQWERAVRQARAL